MCVCHGVVVWCGMVWFGLVVASKERRRCFFGLLHFFRQNFVSRLGVLILGSIPWQFIESCWFWGVYHIHIIAAAPGHMVTPASRFPAFWSRSPQTRAKAIVIRFAENEHLILVSG